MAPNVPAMFVPELSLIPPRSQRGGNDLNRHPNPVDRVLDGFATLDLNLPASIADDYHRARTLLAEQKTTPTVDIAAERGALVAGLVDGTLDLPTADRRLLELHALTLAIEGERRTLHVDANGPHLRDRAILVRTAAGVLYTRAAATIASHGANLTDALRSALKAAITRQAKTKHGLLDPIAVEHYDLVHSLAALLRGWALEDLDGALPDLWRFRRPDAVHRWKLDAIDTAPPRSPIGAAYTGSQVRPDGSAVLNYMRPHGIQPTVADIAAHPEWEPDVVDADDVIAIADGIRRAQLTGRELEPEPAA